MYNQILKKLAKKSLQLPITSTTVTTNNFYDVVVNKKPYTIQTVTCYNDSMDFAPSIFKIILTNNITNRQVIINDESTRGFNRIKALEKHLMSC